MNKNELISFCRYYKGEEENPYKGILANIWDCEKYWLEEALKDSDYLSELTNEYISAGLLTWNETDGTPYLLKALLFNRYRHWLGGYGLESDVKSFQDWYHNVYRANQ